MTNKTIEQRIIIKFLFKSGNTATEIYDRLIKVYGDETLSRARVFDWFKRFSEGRDNVRDNVKTGRPQTIKTEENIKKVLNIKLTNPSLSIRKISEQLHINKETVRRILNEDLNIIKRTEKGNKEPVNTSSGGIEFVDVNRIVINNELVDNSEPVDDKSHLQFRSISIKTEFVPEDIKNEQDSIVTGDYEQDFVLKTELVIKEENQKYM